MYDNCMLSITAQRNGHDSKWEKNFTKPHGSIFIFTSSSGHPTPLSSSSNRRRHLTGVPPWWLRWAAANVQLPCPPPASAAGFLQESESIALVFFCQAQHYVGLNPSSNSLPTSLVGLQTEGPSSRTRPSPPPAPCSVSRTSRGRWARLAVLRRHGSLKPSSRFDGKSAAGNFVDEPTVSLKGNTADFASCRFSWVTL